MRLPPVRSDYNQAAILTQLISQRLPTDQTDRDFPDVRASLACHNLSFLLIR